MSEDKYYYNGIPLSTYCKDNGINPDTVRTRIWKKKHNKKYENYTDQEIVDMVIKTSGTGIKYMYKGKTLRQYCLENDMSISTITQRIANLKKENPDLSNDELVVLAIEGFENKNYKYFYKGVPLKEYCEKHPEINYKNLRGYILEKRTKQPDLSIEEIIEQYINSERDNIKYYYKGTTLRQYCEENDINYSVIISNMKRNRNAEGYKDLSQEEFIERIIDQYEPKEGKYFYKGMSLYEYCKQNNFSYYSVVSFIKRRIERESNKTIDELMDEGIKTIKRHQIKYYYKGIPLIEYAKENGLKANSIRGAIIKEKAKSDRPLQEIIDECVESYQAFQIKYFYDGEPLTTFCKRIGLRYDSITDRYRNNYANNPNISVEEAIKQIVDYYIENPPVITKYYYKDQSLARFCNENGYPYLAITNRIKKMEATGNPIDSDTIIEQYLKEYEKRLEIRAINEIFNQIKNKGINNIDEIIEICRKLKINYENVKELIEMDFTYNQAINMIWYFSDRRNSNGFRMITDEKIEEVLSLIENIKRQNIDIEDVKLYDLIGIYKSELYDTRSEIIERQKRYIKKTLYSLCAEYGIKYNTSSYEEFENEIKYYLLIVVNRTNLNTEGQMIKYMNLTVKGYFRTYLKKYRKENNVYSLDDSRYKDDKGTRKEKARIESIADQNNPYEKKQSLLSSNMMQVLSTLPQDDLTLIMLKYQEDYTEEELSKYFNLTTEEIKEKENRVLSLLRSSKRVKQLRRSKKD